MATTPKPKIKLKNPQAVAERLFAERIKAGKVKDIAKKAVFRTRSLFF